MDLSGQVKSIFHICTGPVHAIVNVDKYIQFYIVLNGCARKVGTGIKGVHGDSKVYIRKLLGQFDVSLYIRSVNGVGQKDILSTAGGCHFQFGKGCTFKLCNILLHLHSNHLGHLVGFNMRAQTPGFTGYGDHPAYVLLYPVGIDQNRRSKNIFFVLYFIPHGLVLSCWECKST